MEFNVIIYNPNKEAFEPYNVIPYLLDQYKKIRPKNRKPTNKEEMITFIEAESRYQWWARCQYEVIISDWPTETTKEKWDIHKQVMMNISAIADALLKMV